MVLVAVDSARMAAFKVRGQQKVMRTRRGSGGGRHIIAHGCSDQVVDQQAMSKAMVLAAQPSFTVLLC